MKRMYFMAKDILDIKLINNNTNIIMFEATNGIVFKNKERFSYKKFDNFEKFLENNNFIEYSYDYYKSKLSEEEDKEEDDEEDDTEDYHIGNIEMKNDKDSKGTKSKKYKSKKYYNESKRTKLFIKKGMLNKIKSRTKK